MLYFSGQLTVWTPVNFIKPRLNFPLFIQHNKAFKREKGRGMTETALHLFTTPVRPRPKQQQQNGGEIEEESQELVRCGLNDNFLRTQRRNHAYALTIGMRLCAGQNYQVQFNDPPIFFARRVGTFKILNNLLLFFRMGRRRRRNPDFSVGSNGRRILFIGSVHSVWSLSPGIPR